MDRILISCIGFKQKQHPIYQIAAEYPVVKHVQLFHSDELHPSSKDPRISVDKNIEEIQEHFGKTRVNVSHNAFPMDEIQQNSFKMAAIILNNLSDHPNCDIIFDLSTSRVPIKLALGRASEIVFNYCKDVFDVPPKIQCATRPMDSNVIVYEIENPTIPKKRDQTMLKFLDRNSRISQTAIASKLSWNNQSEVSKSISRLEEFGYVVKKTQNVTDQGRSVLQFLNSIVSPRMDR